jgi:Mg-chelatase subunit ChlD
MQERGMSQDTSSLKPFAANNSGSVAILFAISVTVVVGVAGLAIDFARGQSTKDALQQDLDATVMYVGAEALKRPQGVDVQALANTYFHGLNRGKLARGPVRLIISQPDAITFSGTAEATVPTALMKLFGFGSLSIKVSSESQIGQQPVEFALVLDNTMSMDGSKITALKSAATDLVDTVYRGVNADQYVKVSVVPFADYVNVGTSHRNNLWMSVPADTTSTQNVCQDVQEATVVPGSCHDVTYNYTQDGVPKTGTETQCSYTYGPPVNQCSNVTTTHTWHGCAGSRNYPWNTKDENYAIKVPGIMDVWCPNELTPLTNQVATVKTAISDMFPTGDTYIPAGLMWGWAALSKSAPYDQAEDVRNGQRVRKIMVLMTDGFNTLSPSVPYDGTHNGSDTAKANTYTAELCTNIKAAGIEIYSVAFAVTDLTVKGILENCASNSSNFYDASNEAALQTAFQKIAADFSPLKLTR